MGSEDLEVLNQISEVSVGTESNDDRVSTLTQAFDLFSQETNRLEKAYRALKQKFTEVNLELEQSNSQLQEKVIELDSTSTYLDSILANITQGIIFVSLKGYVTTYNPAAEVILDVPRGLVFQKRFEDIFTDELFGFSMLNLLEAMRAPKRQVIDYVSPNNLERTLEISVNLAHPNSPSQGVIIVIRDVTKFKRLEILANRNERLRDLGEMAASVAHEIRNPLGGIEGFASLLYRDFEGNAKHQEMAQAIIDGSRTLNQLVSNVLNYASPVESQFAAMDLNIAIEETISLVRADSTFSKKIEIDHQVLEGDIGLIADKIQLKRAFLNLIVNAFHAMKEEGLLTIRTSVENKQMTIQFQDTGPGIPLAHIEKIFSPFYTTKTTGTGIGLAEVHKIMQAHAGEVELTSEENQGSLFTLRLPLTQ